MAEYCVTTTWHTDWDKRLASFKCPVCGKECPFDDGRAECVADGVSFREGRIRQPGRKAAVWKGKHLSGLHRERISAGLLAYYERRRHSTRKEVDGRGKTEPSTAT